MHPVHDNGEDGPLFGREYMTYETTRPSTQFITVGQANRGTHEIERHIVIHGVHDLRLYVLQPNVVDLLADFDFQLLAIADDGER